MEMILSSTHILLMLVLIIMLFVIVAQPRSRAQIAFILFDVFVLIFVFGLEMELLHAQTVDAALSGLAMQYLGQCGFIIALLWFANEFIQMKLPIGIFVGQLAISGLTMMGVITAGYNHLFYRDMRIIHTGYFSRIECENGILWYVHYGYFLIVFSYIIIFCIVKYHTLGPIHRRRILYLLSGLGILLIELILKACGLFGSYNPVGIALTGMVVCMMMAVLKEGYFDSIDATMENVLNHGDEGLIVLDVWSRIIFVNDQAYNLFPGIRSGYPVSSQKDLAAAIEKEGQNTTINGSVWQTRLESISENGSRTGTMIYFINVTDLVLQARELKAASDERVRFMTRASHELRSPLNVVLGADEMILRESHEEPVREYAGMIREEVGSMVNLVEDIINSSLAEQQLLVIREEPFSLKKALLHLNSVYLRKAEDKGLRFEMAWDGSDGEQHPDIFLVGDRNRLLQVLVNLLDNAVKYTEAGRIGLYVTTQEQTEEHATVEFTVQDTGAGIPESEQQSVFEKYRRGQDAENSGKEGLGLGLSIVKSFIESMGGTIRLASRPGFGSSFIVNISFRKARSVPEDSEHPENALEKLPDKVSFAGRRILAVDDRPRNILVMRHLLKETGLSIDEENKGKNAVERCRHTRYDAIIIDYMMPGMDGGETLAAIRKDPQGRNRDTYAVVFSANVTPDAERLYQELGFSDFLPKPVYYDNLLRVLLRAFQAQDSVREQNGEEENASTGAEADAAAALEDNTKSDAEESIASITDGKKEAGADVSTAAPEEAGTSAAPEESKSTAAGAEENAADAPDEDAILQRLRKIGVDTDAGTAYADDDKDFYTELLTSFGAGAAEDRQELTGAWEALQRGDASLESGLDSWKEFTRLAHGIKGELRSFGDSAGAELFFTLEKDGKAKDMEDIRSTLPGALQRLDEFVAAVRGV